MMRELAVRSRSYRRFQQDRAIPHEMLKELVEVARFTPSAGNRQPIKYLLSSTADKNELIFACLAWASYLKDWPGPAEGERPSAYVVILGDKEISESVQWDNAIVAQTMMLAASEKGLGGCIIGAINRDRLRQSLAIPSKYDVLLVLALGYPSETVLIDEMKAGNYQYWRDGDGVHHVPKRPLAELILDL